MLVEFSSDMRVSGEDQGRNREIVATTRDATGEGWGVLGLRRKINQMLERVSARTNLPG